MVGVLGPVRVHTADDPDAGQLDLGRALDDLLADLRLNSACANYLALCGSLAGPGALPTSALVANVASSILSSSS